MDNKSMHTRRSFIGQMSDNFSRQIVLNIFFNHRYTIPQFAFGKTYRGFFRIIQSSPQTIYPRKIFSIDKFQVKNIFSSTSHKTY